MKRKKVLKFQTEKQITLPYILAKFLSFEVPYIISVSYIGHEKAEKFTGEYRTEILP